MGFKKFTSEAILGNRKFSGKPGNHYVVFCDGEKVLSQNGGTFLFKYHEDQDITIFSSSIHPYQLMATDLRFTTEDMSNLMLRISFSAKILDLEKAIESIPFNNIEKYSPQSDMAITTIDKEDIRKIYFDKINSIFRTYISKMEFIDFITNRDKYLPEICRKCEEDLSDNVVQICKVVIDQLRIKEELQEALSSKTSEKILIDAFNTMKKRRQEELRLELEEERKRQENQLQIDINRADILREYTKAYGDSDWKKISAINGTLNNISMIEYKDASDKTYKIKSEEDIPPSE